MDDTLTKLNTIFSNLKIKANCLSVKKHRHSIVCYISLDPGQRVRKLELHLREIGLALCAKTTPILSVHLEQGLITLQFAVSNADTLYFDKYYNDNFINRPKGLLPFLFGESSDGKPVWVDMAYNPHLLVAGATGSGKSVLLHTIIANALKRDDVWLYLSDPKGGVEFGLYENCDNVNLLAKDYNTTLSMLESLYEEMERRYEFLAKMNISTIEHSPFIFPKILLVIDELADLMLVDKSKRNPTKGKFESLLCSIAQKSRASGIYCIVGTQRPSVDVVSGVIKANFPARVACKVSTAVDSKVVLDKYGAESLLGRGDAILNNLEHEFIRFQVAFKNLENVRKVA